MADDTKPIYSVGPSEPSIIYMYEHIVAEMRDELQSIRARLSEAESRTERIWEEAAKVADFYAETNKEQMGDSILIDPLLRGGPATRENIERSKSLAIDGCVHSAMYHAATNIASALRQRAKERQ